MRVTALVPAIGSKIERNLISAQCPLSTRFGPHRPIADIGQR